MNKLIIKRKGHLVDAIANASCDSVDLKTLMQMHYDDVAGQMNDLDLDELLEIADDMGIEVEEV